MVKKTEKAEKKTKKKKKGAEVCVIVNKGAWTAEEDQKLMDYVVLYGDKKWRSLPAKAGLSRCGKSCRLRWLNYLRPGIKRGNISEDEEDLIIRLHNLLGNRWSLIAGRLPGRTDNEIKNHWNTHLSKKSLTINDLNSKIHNRKLDCSNDDSGSDGKPVSDLPAGKIEQLPIPENQSLTSPSVAPLEYNRGTGAGCMPRVDDYSNHNVDFESCLQSPSALWLQSFSCEEIYAVTDFLEHKNLFPHFP